MNLIGLHIAIANSMDKIGSMSDELKGAIITALVTCLVSIIGFIITNISMKKNFKNESKKQRDNIALEKMSVMPFEVLELMDEMMNINKTKDDNLKNELQKENSNHFKHIMNTIYSYGSENAIKLVSLMQQENYRASGNTIELDKFRVMASYVLLATQIKYDVTEISVSPELWFQMRLTDYSSNKSSVKKANNNLVEELGLINAFKIR